MRFKRWQPHPGSHDAVANISEDGGVRFYAELPEMAATTEEWLESIRLEDAGRSLVTSVKAAVDDEPPH